MASAALFFLRRWYRVSVLVGTLLCLILAGLAWQFPIEQTVRLGPWALRLADTFSLLGRQLTLNAADQPLLTLIYLIAAFWFGASYIGQAGRLLVPLGLAMVVALTAALAVKPFLYAALLIELAALLAIPILSEPGSPVQRGVLRFLTFQTMGMPFLLFTGWLLEGSESGVGNPQMMLRAILLIVFGLAFILAIFPFHTWVPMLAGQARPYPAAFVLTIVPLMVILFGIGLLDQYASLRNYPNLPELLQRLGLVVCLTSSIGMAFERNMGRILGYAILVETGFSLLALGLPGGALLSISMILPRTLAVGVWALGLMAIQAHHADLKYYSLSGAAWGLPFASAAVLVAQFSIAGFPLLAGFPIRLALWEGAAAQSIWVALGALISVAGLFVSSLRTLAVLVKRNNGAHWTSTESFSAKIFLGIGIAAIILVGITPQWVLPVLAEVIQSFPKLVP